MESKSDFENIISFLNEAGMLKNTPRTGWLTIRAPNESVAEHSYRTALFGMMLSKISNMSKQDELMLIKGCLIHDLHECRITDLHKIAQNYVKADYSKAEKDMVDKLPETIKNDIFGCLSQNLPKKIADYVHDADKLECALSAKEYVDLGYKAQQWIDNCGSVLKTKEGKELFLQIIKLDTLKWMEKQRGKWVEKDK